MRSGRLLRSFSVVSVIFLWSCILAPLPAQSFQLHDPIQDKNFYLLSVLKQNPKLRNILVSDSGLAQIAAERKGTLVIAQRACKQDAACVVKAMLWTDEEIQAVSLDLDRLASEDATVRALVENDLRPSRAYILFAKEPSGQLLANAWEACARGLNDALSVYGEGLPPRYPEIDSITVDVKSAEFRQQIAVLAAPPQQGSAAPLFFEPSLDAALKLLALNHRDEAGRFEPMETGVNAPAIKLIPSIHWQDDAYSVIVVPGAGGTDYNTSLSDAGRKRCILAAEAFHAGKAPLILVSGGYVHPSQTHFSEAIEMKKALIADYHIPESAILVDPHARHTTTNMRNAAREIFRYGIPADKPALVVSDSDQVGYIASQTFANRCLRELGYVPYRIVRRDSDTAVAFTPLIESLQQDPMDPLDP